MTLDPGILLDAAIRYQEEDMYVGNNVVQHITS